MATSGHSHVCLAQVPFLLFPSVMGVNFSALHIIDPLIAGALLGAGWTAGPIMTVTACGPVFVVLFSVWLSRRRVEGLSADEAAAKTSERAQIAGWRLRRQHRAPNNPAGA